MLNLIYTFLFLIIFCNHTKQQQKYSPPNNCSYFKYYYNSTKYYGILKTPDVGKSIQLSVHFTQRTPIPENVSVKHLLKRKSKEPFSFLMDFPNANEMPKLTKLTVNGQDICVSNDYPAPSSTFSISYSYSTRAGDQQQKQPVKSNIATASPKIYTNNSVLQKLTQYPKKGPQLTPGKNVAPSVAQYGQCGEENRLGEYIVGGDELKPGQFPWLAAIYHKKESNLIFLCGGSLISPRTVLTAGHCVKRHSLSAAQLLVHLGRYNLEDFVNERYVIRNIETLIVHHDYDPQKLSDADLAILQLQSSVKYTSMIRPICLWSETSDISRIVGQIGIVAGWGADGTGRSSTAIPKKIKTRIVSDFECRSSSARYNELIPGRYFCAGNRDGTGPCTGDSGSGLMIYRNGRWYLRGVVSIGQMKHLACDMDHFVVFCDIAKHLQWIKSKMLF